MDAPPALAAPASWKAGLREYWKTLAPDVQAEIHRREGENAERMRENAQLRQHMGRFNQVVEPYRALIEAEGGEPLAAFHDYLKAATLLRTGAPNDRAAFVAALVQRYGVPLDALDAHLAQAIQRGPRRRRAAGLRSRRRCRRSRSNSATRGSMRCWRTSSSSRSGDTQRSDQL